MKTKIFAKETFIPGIRIVRKEETDDVALSSSTSTKVEIDEKIRMEFTKLFLLLNNLGLFIFSVWHSDWRLLAVWFSLASLYQLTKK